VTESALSLKGEGVVRKAEGGGAAFLNDAERNSWYRKAQNDKNTKDVKLKNGSSRDPGRGRGDLRSIG
jgi:hypothetical protein